MTVLRMRNADSCLLLKSMVLWYWKLCEVSRQKTTTSSSRHLPNASIVRH